MTSPGHGQAWRDVDATPIAWREAGPQQGDLVVLLHGLGGSRVAWNPQLVALADAGYHAVAWDMPGYGASAWPDAPVSFPALTAAVAGLVTTHGSGAAHIVGLSLGGMIAQHVAVEHAGTVRSLTLIDSSPAFGLDGSTTAETWIERRLQPMRDGATPATMAESVMRGIMAPDATDDAVAAGVAAMSRISAEALAGSVRCLVTHDLRGRLHTIVAPTLVMVGEHDAETPRPYAEHLASAITGARLETVPGAGHISNLESPDRVNELLLDFLHRVH